MNQSVSAKSKKGRNTTQTGRCGLVHTTRDTGISPTSHGSVSVQCATNDANDLGAVYEITGDCTDAGMQHTKQGTTRSVWQPGLHRRLP